MWLRTEWLRKRNLRTAILLFIHLLLFFLLGAHLRVASTYYFNPVSDELVGLITYYLVIVLIYCAIIIIFLLKIFIAENEKAFRPRTETYIHTYLYL